MSQGKSLTRLPQGGLRLGVDFIDPQSRGLSNTGMRLTLDLPLFALPLIFQTQNSCPSV